MKKKCKSNPVTSTFVVFGCLLSVLSGLKAETLTDTQGRSIEVNILRVDTNSVLVKTAAGKETTIPFANLSGDSLAVLKARPVPGGPKNPTVEIVSNAAGRLTDKSWETSWGSYDKDVFRSRALTVTVSAETAGAVTLEIYWIGSIAGKSSERGVVLTSKKSVEIAAQSPQSHEFAALFVESDAKYAALGVRDRNGLKYVGWVARLVGKDGSVLVTKASRPPLVDILKLPPLVSPE